MSRIRDKILEAADRLATQSQDQIRHLQSEVSAIKAQLKNKEADFEKENLAPQRRSSFDVGTAPNLAPEAQKCFHAEEWWLFHKLCPTRALPSATTMTLRAFSTS